MLGRMRIKLLLPGLLFMLWLAGCRCHRDVTRLLPVAPAPLTGPTTALVTIAPETPAGDLPAPAMPERIQPTSEEAAPKYSLSELSLELEDAYFELDQHDLRADGRRALRLDSAVLKTIESQSPHTMIVIEGHCDERGSSEYNLALGAMRAEAAKVFLLDLGIPAASLKTITYGKERPQCTVQAEDCWQKNRRAHLAPDNR
jgi:peptidoglycan-associated lipoprotein